MVEIQSLKNKQRLLAILMFLATLISALGSEQLAQLLPWASTATITLLVTGSAWLISQYGTEARVVRAEEKKEAEIISTMDTDNDAIEG